MVVEVEVAMLTMAAQKEQVVLEAVVMEVATRLVVELQIPVEAEVVQEMETLVVQVAPVS
jgi:hypothetical protein